MHNFFVEENDRNADNFYISGTDYNHIKKVLRMKIGDTFLVSCNGISNLCELNKIEENIAIAKIIEENYNDTNLPVEIYLFQGLPKADKMELIIQKTVELGVSAIIPTEMNRCVVKLEEKKKRQKQERWQAIAESAAKQSKRNSIPEVYETVSYKKALEIAKDLDLLLVPNENKDGMKSTKEALKKIKSGMKIGIIIGPEGGFDENEIESAIDNGGNIISLGKRILRTETAAITAVGMCMLYTEINEDLL